MDLGVTSSLDHVDPMLNLHRTTLTFPRTTWHLADPSEGDAVPHSEDELKPRKLPVVAAVLRTATAMPRWGT